MVIDFHSHVLPKMDDGSKSVEMSLEMLRSEKNMGVGAVVATPHFYGFRESVSAFLKRRERCFQGLSEALEDGLPAIYLGAEVAFFSGITGLEDLNCLCLEGTKTLLLEMPFAQWTEYELDAVSTLCLDRGYHVVLAHLERFYPLQKDERVLERILALPLWVQLNAESLLPITRRGRWVQMFQADRAHLLGSDCHNLTGRPPNLGAGRRVLEHKMGKAALERIDDLGMRLLTVDAAEGPA